MKKLLLAMLLVFILFFGFIGIWFGSALAQEGNPMPYLMAVGKYEFSNSKYEEVLNTATEIRYVSESGKEDSLGIVKKFMEAEGWEFNEQLGSGLIFDKGEETIVIETRQYPSHYFIWDVPREITD